MVESWYCSSLPKNIVHVQRQLDPIVKICNSVQETHVKMSARHTTTRKKCKEEERTKKQAAKLVQTTKPIYVTICSL